MEAQFTAASEFVRTFKPSKTVPNDAKLKAYALFKQATVGDVNIARPGGMFNFEANAKWDAWNALKGMSKEEAMRLYVEELESQKAQYA